MDMEAFRKGTAFRAAALIFLLASCATDDLTSPAADEGAETTAIAPVPVAAEARLVADPAEAVAGAVQDAIDRVVPALAAEDVPTTTLGSALQRMATALEGADREALSRAAERGAEAIAELRDGHEDALETRVQLDVIGLAIDRAVSLGPPVDESGPPRKRKRER